MGYPTDDEITGRSGADRRTRSSSLNELAGEAYRVSKEHGFHERPKSMGEYVAALIHTNTEKRSDDVRLEG
jgi:hypothetical protein